jgi:hypothetical protein
MSAPGGSAKPLSQKALRLLVSDLAGKIERLEHEVEQLRLDNSNSCSRLVNSVDLSECRKQLARGQGFGF